jgi:hypothetical protein
MSIELPNKLTPLTADEAAKCLANGYKRVTGKLPSAAILALLIGQWAGETGNGQYIHNFNFGNVKHSSKDVYFQKFQGSEIINGKNVVQIMDFAAYKTADDGAEAYIRQLKARPQWWAGLQTGDVTQFVDGLVAVPGQHYFTADYNEYLDLLKERMANYVSLAKKYSTSKWGIFFEVVFGLAAGAAGVYSVREIRKYKIDNTRRAA